MKYICKHDSTRPVFAPTAVGQLRYLENESNMRGSPEPSREGLAPSLVPIWPLSAAAETIETVQLNQSRPRAGIRETERGGKQRGGEGAEGRGVISSVLHW